MPKTVKLKFCYPHETFFFISSELSEVTLLQSDFLKGINSPKLKIYKKVYEEI